MLAVLSGHTDCVYSLLNKGASVEAKDKWGRTALHRGVKSFFCVDFGGSLCYFATQIFTLKQKLFNWNCIKIIAYRSYNGVCSCLFLALFSIYKKNLCWKKIKDLNPIIQPNSFYFFSLQFRRGTSLNKIIKHTRKFPPFLQDACVSAQSVSWRC